MSVDSLERVSELLHDGAGRDALTTVCLRICLSLPRPLGSLAQFTSKPMSIVKSVCDWSSVSGAPSLKCVGRGTAQASNDRIDHLPFETIRMRSRFPGLCSLQKGHVLQLARAEVGLQRGRRATHVYRRLGQCCFWIRFESGWIYEPSIALIAQDSNPVTFGEQCLFESFSNGNPPVNCMIRDYGLGILECCLAQKSLAPVVDMVVARPPYASAWPLQFVLDEVIDGYQEVVHSHRSSDRIVGSTVNDGDFTRYVLDRHVARWSPAPLRTYPLPSHEDVKE